MRHAPEVVVDRARSILQRSLHAAASRFARKLP
jgi:hypothetical protein